MSLILSFKLHKNIYPIHLQELQSSNKHNRVSDNFIFSSVPLTHLSIYILHILSTHMMYSLLYNYLPFSCTSLIISHKTYLNIHDNIFISTISLIFTSQSHIILSGCLQKDWIPYFVISTVTDNNHSPI